LQITVKFALSTVVVVVVVVVVEMNII